MVAAEGVSAAIGSEMSGMERKADVQFRATVQNRSGQDVAANLGASMHHPVPSSTKACFYQCGPWRAIYIAPDSEPILPEAKEALQKRPQISEVLDFPRVHGQRPCDRPEHRTRANVLSIACPLLNCKQPTATATEAQYCSLRIGMIADVFGLVPNLECIAIPTSLQLQDVACVAADHLRTRRQPEEMMCAHWHNIRYKLRVRYWALAADHLVDDAHI
jgi:hypothetical protein